MTCTKTIANLAYIKILSVLGVVSTFLAVVSVNTATPWVYVYEPEMPSLLIKRD